VTDPLAHLYAETGGGDVDEELELPVVETSLEKLTAERGADVEELSDHDLDELALLVGAKLEADGGLPDEEAAELGLGTIVEHEPALYRGPGGTINRAPIPDRELVLNSTGRAVLRRIIAQRHPGIRFEGQE
jgi:hypothetical protein